MFNVFDAGAHVTYRESDSLTNIDGFLVTDGTEARVTLRRRLNNADKERGKRELLRQFHSNNRPGVYLWNSSDTYAYYDGPRQTP